MRGPASASPRRGTLSFVTQKFFCFGAINNRRNNWCIIPFCCHSKRGIPSQPAFQPCRPLISIPYGAAGTVISKQVNDILGYARRILRARSRRNTSSSAGGVDSNELNSGHLSTQTFIGDVLADNAGRNLIVILNSFIIRNHRQISNLLINQLADILQSVLVAHTEVGCIQAESSGILVIILCQAIVTIIRNAHILCNLIPDNNVRDINRSRSNIMLTTNSTINVRKYIFNHVIEVAVNLNIFPQGVFQSRIGDRINDVTSILIHTVPHHIGSVADSRLRAGRIIASIIGRAVTASGQHADGHNAGQHQRGNLLEFHNEFFLLMVYKR